MATTDTAKAIIWEGKDVTCMARVHVNGQNATQSDVASIERKVYDLSGSTPDTAIDETALTVTSVIFDSLQTDGRWDTDTTGYNFRDTIGGTMFADGGHRYRVEYHFTGANGELFAVVFELTAKNLYAV